VKEEVLVSIAMATYNGEKFIKKQIESILNQTYKNLEIVICDDNSIDNTFKILKEYADKDKRIKLYKNCNNLGFVKNFEKAINLSKGKYIALSDQDDIWVENKIEILLKEIGEYDLIHSDAYLINENAEIIFNSYSKFVNKYLNPKDIIELACTPMVTGCTCMFTSELKEKILPICSEIHVHDIWISFIAFKNGGIKYCDKPLIKYRQHENNQIGAIKKTGNIFSKIKKLKHKNLIINDLDNVFFKALGKINCIENLSLSKEEVKNLDYIKKMFYYLGNDNIKSFFYFYKISNKIWLNQSLYERYKKIFTLYIKILIINYKFLKENN